MRHLWLIPAIILFVLAIVCFQHLNGATFSLGVVSILGGICCLYARKEHK